MVYIYPFIAGHGLTGVSAMENVFHNMQGIDHVGFGEVALYPPHVVVHPLAMMNKHTHDIELFE